MADQEEPLVVDLQMLLRMAYGFGLRKGMSIDIEEYMLELFTANGLDIEAELCVEGMEEFNDLLNQMLAGNSIVLSPDLVL